MKQLRLWPQSLVGQIIILVAIALFVAQAINFGLLLRERNRVELTSQTAPLVYRVINALDTRPDRAPDRDHPRANQDRDRRNIDFLASRPTLSGKPRPDVAARAGAMFDDIGLTAMALIQMMTGVIVWYRPGERLSIDGVTETYLSMTMRLVGAPQPAGEQRHVHAHA